WISGLFLFTERATSLRSVVFPALGGDTIMPLCPFPMGESRSMMRMAVLLLPLSSDSLSLGKIGVRSSKLGLLAATAGWISLIFDRYKRALNFSCWVFILVLPSRISPVF